MERGCSRTGCLLLLTLRPGAFPPSGRAPHGMPAKTDTLKALQRAAVRKAAADDAFREALADAVAEHGYAEAARAAGTSRQRAAVAHVQALEPRLFLLAKRNPTVPRGLILARERDTHAQGTA